MLTLLLIIANVLLSYQAFSNFALRERFKLRVANLNGGEWYRLFTSGFIHVSWNHLLFNMLSLYFIGSAMENIYASESRSPILWYLVLYFGSMAAGGGLAWLMKRREPMYSSVGASGAISGLLFALAITYPFAKIFFIIPLWFYAIGFMIYSLYGIRAQRDNIGHEAHLGGSLFGILIACLITPAIVPQYWYLILALTLPPASFIYLSVYHPLAILDPRRFFRIASKGVNPSRQSGPRVVHVRQDKPSVSIPTHRELQDELDGLLEKVGKKGLDGLSKKERNRLDELSGMLDGNRRSDV